MFYNHLFQSINLVMFYKGLVINDLYLFYRLSAGSSVWVREKMFIVFKLLIISVN